MYITITRYSVQVSIYFAEDTKVFEHSIIQYINKFRY